MSEDNKPKDPSDPTKFDFTAEPKRYFTNKLLWNLNHLELIIFDDAAINQRGYHYQNYDIQPIFLGVLYSLDAKTKESVFKQEIKALEACEINSDLVSMQQLKRMYNKLNSYVHESYLKDNDGYKGIDPNEEAKKL